MLLLNKTNTNRSQVIRKNIKNNLFRIKKESTDPDLISYKYYHNHHGRPGRHNKCNKISRKETFLLLPLPYQIQNQHL
uniref:Uncharacterized protein n=1 Tax=Arundo donax TaxID=35708 RepID=A0A0A9F6D5_ARUDO